MWLFPRPQKASIPFAFIIARPPPSLLWKGGLYFWGLKSGGGFREFRNSGATFQVKPPIFSRWGWTLIKEMHSLDLKSTIFQKFLPALGFVSLFLHVWWDNFQKFFTCNWHLRGPGGPRSIFTFLLFLIVENGSYQELFSEWKNIVPSQSYWIFKSRKYIQLHCARKL